MVGRAGHWQGPPRRFGRGGGDAGEQGLAQGPQLGQAVRLLLRRADGACAARVSCLLRERESANLAVWGRGCSFCWSQWGVFAGGQCTSTLSVVGGRARADQEEAACAVEVLVGWVELLDGNHDGILDPCVHRRPVGLVSLVRDFFRFLQRLDLSRR